LTLTFNVVKIHETSDKFQETKQSYFAG